MKHVVVHNEPERFLGWPANNGIWSWGDEIVVGFTSGDYVEKIDEHSISKSRPALAVLARSMDGGETWAHEQPTGYQTSDDAMPLTKGVDFTHPDLAIRCWHVSFLVSYDRCRTWEGPYGLPDFGFKEQLTSRTDYIANGRSDCMFFLSVHEPHVRAGLADRAFCVRTKDGGQTFSFGSWMLFEPPEVRSVMPSTVRISDAMLVSALRRRLDTERSGQRQIDCWIDVSQSQDNGKTWQFLSRVAETGAHNGSPPSMIRLPDGALCVTYGYRSGPIGIRAKLSHDLGKSWGNEIVLRNDGRTWDIGYPRSVVRPDGNVMTVYYYTTEDNARQHIAATIWDPRGHNG